jgi:hypothetical protein
MLLSVRLVSLLCTQHTNPFYYPFSIEEERILAEERAVEEEKERKRKAKQDKVDAQKAAGTYLTKGEKKCVGRVDFM